MGILPMSGGRSAATVLNPVIAPDSQLVLSQRRYIARAHQKEMPGRSVARIEPWSTS